MLVGRGSDSDDEVQKHRERVSVMHVSPQLGRLRSSKKNREKDMQVQNINSVHASKGQTVMQSD